MTKDSLSSVMYSVLCGAASEAIELMDRGLCAQARERLQSALYEAEEMYIREAEEPGECP